MRCALAAGLAVAMLAIAPAAADAQDAGAVPPPPPPGAAEPDAGDNSVLAPLEDTDPPVLVARVDTTQVAIGEPFLLLITATYRDIPEGVNLPGSINLGSAFEALDDEWDDGVSADGSQVRTFEIEVIAWQVGELLIPPIQLTYAIGGQAYAVMTDPVPIQIVSFVGEGDEVLRDIAGPVEVERRDWTLVTYAALAFVSFVTTVILILLRRRMDAFFRRLFKLERRPRGKATIDTRLPHEIALARIARLEESGMLDDDDRKPAYVELSDILRGYLGRRYGFAALDMTTSEIKANVSRRAADIEALCNPWLDDCDLVKFANHKPHIDEAHLALQRARDIIIATVPRPAPPPAPPPPAPPVQPPPPAQQPVAPAIDEVPGA